MKTIRLARSLAGLSTALLIAACGGGGATSAPGATTPAGATAATGAVPTQAGPATQGPGGGQVVDACSLLTEADIRDVTGHDTASATGGPQFGIFNSGCQWELIDPAAIVPPSIGLGVMTVGGLDYYKTYFEPFNAEYGYEAVEGVGDAAVNAEAGSVLVVSGDAFFNLQYIGFTGDDGGVAADLAGKVVAHLGR